MSEIHVFDRRDGVAVWLDTEVAEEDGLCIGFAKTRADALTEAIDDLKARLSELRKMRDVEKERAAGEGR